MSSARPTGGPTWTTIARWSISIATTSSRPGNSPSAAGIPDKDGRREEPCNAKALRPSMLARVRQAFSLTRAQVEGTDGTFASVPYVESFLVACSPWKLAGQPGKADVPVTRRRYYNRSLPRAAR